MTRKSGVVVGWGLLAAFLLTAGLADAKPDKDPSLKDIMAKLNDKDTGLLVGINKGLKQDDPDWAALQKLTKQYLDGAEAVPQKDPPKGEKDSWAKLSKSFVAAAKSVDEAANAKDQKACKDACEKMMMGCRACHMAHRVMKPK
jgi:cytochrome c556